MTEQELIGMQEANGNQTFYLMKVGLFFHAYNAGAYALARVTGYRVKRKKRKKGKEVLIAGFPAGCLTAVMDKLRNAGGTVVSQTELWIEFTGIDGSEDKSFVDPLLACQEIKEIKNKGIAERILSFNLSDSTPLEAMNFIASLQKEVKKEKEE